MEWVWGEPGKGGIRHAPHPGLGVMSWGKGRSRIGVERTEGEEWVRRTDGSRMGTEH